MAVSENMSRVDLFAGQVLRPEQRIQLLVCQSPGGEDINSLACQSVRAEGDTTTQNPKGWGVGGEQKRKKATWVLQQIIKLSRIESKPIKQTHT